MAGWWLLCSVVADTEPTGVLTMTEVPDGTRETVRDA